jgi:hypothetical protein
VVDLETGITRDNRSPRIKIRLPLILSLRGVQALIILFLGEDAGGVEVEVSYNPHQPTVTTPHHPYKTAGSLEVDLQFVGYLLDEEVSSTSFLGEEGVEVHHREDGRGEVLVRYNGMKWELGWHSHGLRWRTKNGFVVLYVVSSILAIAGGFREAILSSHSNSRTINS